MTHHEIRKNFLDFFEKRGHKIVPSSSLVPDDPSVLFTPAGMQQFKKYYLDSDSPYGNRVVSIQKCLRTTDIDQVGDESHLTFFEMLGNFSFKFPEAEDAYFKEEAIKSGYDFIVRELGVPLERLKISVFGGDNENKLPADDQSLAIWKVLGIPGEKIFFGDKNDNFWGPTGLEGPCGPTTEIHIDRVEVWNIVFNEYYCDKDKSFTKLEKLGVDTGMGLERLAVILQKKKNIFETDLFEPIMRLLPEDLDIRKKRIIADHARAIVFLVSDGVRPSNKERGYVLRRLMRRIITYFYIDKTDLIVMHYIFSKIIETYSSYYPELNANTIIHEFDSEEEKFKKILPSAIKELEKIKQDITPEELGNKIVNIYESQGMPVDSSIEFLKRQGFNQFVIEGFENTVRVRKLEHQEKSRAGLEKKFKK